MLQDSWFGSEGFMLNMVVFHPYFIRILSRCYAEFPFGKRKQR